MSKIITHLWFDTQAVAAAEFYCTVFANAKITSKTVIENTPSGNVDNVILEIEGSEFNFISAGPIFKINPSISFMVSCSSIEEVDELWSKLIDGGMALMELKEYDFSKKYGWLQDKFGVSWQIAFTDQKISQKIVPSLLFVGDVWEKTEEAARFYTSVLPNSKVDDNSITRYSKEEREFGNIKYLSFSLMNKQFAAMDSKFPHDFGFNEAVSFVVYCDSQEEIDEYWAKLSFVPESEQCGWLKDKYGVSWQIVPTVMDEMMKTTDKNKLAKVTEAFLQMKKFDVAELERVFGEN